MTKIITNTCKKFSTIILAVILITTALAGCSSKKANEKNPAVKEISEKVKQTVDISKMRQGDSKKLEKIYDISSDDVAEFALYTAPSNITVDEIAIIKVKDSNKVNEIKEKISKRIEAQGENFKEYIPKEYALIEKHILKTQGDYIFLAVSKDAEKIEEAFDGFFK